jgi:hypothetical protein
MSENYFCVFGEASAAPRWGGHPRRDIFHGRVNHEQDIIVHFSHDEGSAVQKRAQGKQGLIFGSVGRGTLESLLMSAHVQPSPLLLSVPTSFSSRRHDRAVRAAEHRAVRCRSEARSNRSGTVTIASECPLTTVRLGLYSFPTLSSSLRVHRPSRRPPVQDDCKQVQSFPALTATHSPLFSNFVPLSRYLDDNDQH